MSFVAIAITATVVGTGIGIANTIQAGKEADKIAKANAAVEMENAKAARRQAEEKARIKAERGRRLIATQKANAAAGGIKINTGSPLVIEEETQEALATDIGFIMEQGRAEHNYFQSSAGIHRMKGQAAKRSAKASAWSQGFRGVGSIAFMGVDAGLGGGAKNAAAKGNANANWSGTNTAPGFNSPTQYGTMYT